MNDFQSLDIDIVLANRLNETQSTHTLSLNRKT